MRSQFARVTGIVSTRCNRSRVGRAPRPATLPRKTLAVPTRSGRQRCGEGLGEGLSFIRKYCLEFSAAKRRQDVATGVSPWNIVQHTPKAPEGGDRSSGVVDPASESHALEKRTNRFTNVYAMMQVFLSPPSGAFRDGIFRNQGLTPLATSCRPLRGLEKRWQPGTHRPEQALRCLGVGLCALPAAAIR
jgi:hypothetical protein